MPSPSATSIRSRQRRGIHHGAGRIGGARDQHAVERLALVLGEQRLGRERPARLASWFRSAPARSRARSGYAGTADSPDWRARRGRPASNSARNARMKPARRAGRHDDARRDRPQRRRCRDSAARCARAATECRALRCSRACAFGSASLRRLDRGRRRRRGRLADLHVNDAAAGGLDRAPPPPSRPSP